MSAFLESVRNFKKSTEEMSVWSFVRMLILYLLLTLVLFLFTSGGWSSLMVLFVWGLVLSVLGLISLLWAAYLSSVYKKPLIIFDKRFFLILIIVQLITVLLNFNDNGDNPGHYTFIQNISAFRDAGFLDLFSFPLDLIYFVLLVSFLFLSFKKVSGSTSEKIPNTVNVPRQGSGNIIGAIIGGMFVVLIIPWSYFFQFPVIDIPILSLFQIPVIFWPAMIMLGCVVGILFVKLFKLTTTAKKSSLLLLLLWPLAFWLSVLGIEYRMKDDLNKSIYPHSIMIHEEVQVFGINNILLGGNSVATAYYEMPQQNPAPVDFFNETFGSQAIRKSDSDWGKFRNLVYYLKGKVITIHEISDTSYLEKEILQKMKPGKKYYSIDIEYRDESLEP